MATGLTEKQKQFCREYLKDFNGTQAAIRCGYSENSAKQIASENLTKLDIVTYLNTLLQEKANNDNITISEIIKDLKDIKKNTSEKTSDRLKALELLGRYLQMFTDKLQLSGDKENPVNIDFSMLSVPEMEMLQEVQRILRKKHGIESIDSK
jgi:phage terminase small subunit